MNNDESTGYIVQGKYQWCKVNFVVPQGAVAGPDFLIICDLFLEKIDSDIVNYADDKTPYTPGNYADVNTLYTFNTSKYTAIEWFEGKVYKHFGCFFDNYIKDTYVCVSGGKKYSFFRKFGMLCFLETPVLSFALLPYYRRIKGESLKGKFIKG